MSLVVVKRPPDFLGGRRHIDFRRCAGAYESVRNGVHQRGQRAGDAALAGAFDAQRILRRRHRMKFRCHRRHAVGPRHRIVHERAGEELAVVAILAMLHEDLAQALAYAAMDLAMHDRRIDDGADVIDGDIAIDGDRAGFRIELDLADMASVGKVHVGRDVIALGIEARKRQGIRRQRDLSAPDRADRSPGRFPQREIFHV